MLFTHLLIPVLLQRVLAYAVAESLFVLCKIASIESITSEQLLIKFLQNFEPIIKTTLAILGKNFSCFHWTKVETYAFEVSHSTKEFVSPLVMTFTCGHCPWEKNCHRELTVVTAPGTMITAQSRLGEVTAQSRRGHSSVTARSQLSHIQLNHGIFSMITAQSRLGHSSITAQVTAGCDHFVHRELTMSSRWALTVADFFLMGDCDEHVVARLTTHCPIGKHHWVGHWPLM